MAVARPATPPAGPAVVPALRRGLVTAVLAYAAVRALGLLILAVWAAAEGESAHHRLSGRWDAVWYARIAEDGYGYTATLADGGVHPDLAFFPLLPALERAGAAVLPLSVNDVGLLVAWVAGLAAAGGIHAVAARVTGRPAVGVALAALWGAYPTAFVQSMAYTESLFTALAAWALYAVLTGRWPVAATLVVAAGLTRPSGAAVVAAVWVAAAVAWRRGEARPAVWISAALAPLGWLGYVGYVAWRRGDPLGYFAVQGEWGNGFDGGWALARFTASTAAGNPAAGLGLCAALALVGWLLWRCVALRLPLPVLAYTAVVVATSLVGSGYFGSRPRLMMPAFALLWPAAVVLATRPGRGRAVLVVAAAAVASGVYGALTLLGSGPP